ncbi:Lrp/AsnC family transcriptional regulator [Roseateles cavernae]|uniref:Lrp/AsnC family transcriptional regulator n=1 Tax=Roseateles cavernae TaxID=3153578 RepID=UPI0032E39934
MGISLQLDDKAWLLLQALQSDGRAPLKTLAAATGLSIPATAERLRRLQEAGVISGIHAELDPLALGYAVRAIIGITAAQPAKAKLLAKLRTMAEVLECHHVTGADSYVMTVVAPGMAELEALIARINAYGETRTAIVMSTPIPRRGLQPCAAQGKP